MSAQAPNGRPFTAGVRAKIWRGLATASQTRISVRVRAGFCLLAATLEIALSPPSAVLVTLTMIDGRVVYTIHFDPITHVAGRPG